MDRTRIVTIPLLTRRQILPVSRRAWLWPLLAATLGQLACQTGSPGPPAAPPPEHARPTLTAGVAVERRLEPGGSHEEVLRLEAGQFLLLTVKQKGIDVALSLADPDGLEIAAADDPEGRVRPERLAVITKVPGEYRLTIVPHKPETPGGTYELGIRELRPAGPGDAERVAAERAFAEGRRLEIGGDEERLRQSLIRFNEALESWRSAADPEGQVRALVEIAGVHYELSELQTSIDRCEEALRLARDVNYEEGVAAALLHMGNAYSSLKDVPAALSRYEEALKLWRELGDQGGEGKTLCSLGILLMDIGERDQAFDPLRQALVLLREAGDIGTEVLALAAISDIYLNRGEIGQALELIERALKLSEEVDQPGAKANVLYNLGRIQRLRGEMEKALASFEQSQEINHHLGSQYEPRTLGAIGSVYHDLGDLDKARAYFERFLVLSQTLGRRSGEARALNNLGWVLYRQGKLAEALDSSTKALAISRTLPDEQLLTASTLQNVGVVEIALGRLEPGLAALTEALSIRREKGTLFDQVQTFREIGTAYHRLGDVQQAAASFGQALDLARQMGSPGQQAETLFRQALLDRDQGRLEEALRGIREAVDIVESVRSRVASETLRTSFFASKRSYYELYLDLLMRLHDTNPGGGHEATALAASELARARGLLDLLAGKVDLTQGIDLLLKQREAELVGRISWILDRLGLQKSASGSAEAEALRRQLADTEADLERLEAETRLRFPEYAEIRYPTPLSLDGVQALLDEKTAFLEYFVGQESSFLFVVTREGLTSYRLPPAEQLSSQVRSLRDVLRQPLKLQFPRFRKEARQLHEELLAPAAKILAEKPDLLISPDGPLHLLPFEALLTGEAGRSFADCPYLLRSHAVSYIPSASVLAGLGRLEPLDPRTSKKFIAFADPVLAAVGSDPPTRSAAGPELAQLPGTRDEVRAIAELYPPEQVALYLGDLATEENVKDNRWLENAPRVHMATHGVFYEDRPERSALVLTPPGPGSREDGYLRVDEIFNLKLGADLLVLSACETGRGQEVRGEGLVGLTRAFLYAGARSLVVSLWPVLDTTTPDLMVGFYSHLSPGQSKAEALRQAKLRMIENGWDHPYYWAPFILAGDPKEPPSSM